MLLRYKPTIVYEKSQYPQQKRQVQVPLFNENEKDEEVEWHEENEEDCLEDSAEQLVISIVKGQVREGENMTTVIKRLLKGRENEHSDYISILKSLLLKYENEFLLLR